MGYGKSKPKTNNVKKLQVKNETPKKKNQKNLK